jgi:hypothetical protein
MIQGTPSKACVIGAFSWWKKLTVEEAGSNVHRL